MAVLVAYMLAATAPPVPRATLVQREIRVQLPASILDNGEVRKQIDSGLTTAFLVRVKAPPITDEEPFRIDVRCELWDETYVVVTNRKGFPRTQATLESFDALRAWWERTAVPAARVKVVPRRIHLIIEMVPFSAHEEADARRWLSESVSQITSERGGAASGSTKKGSAGSILDAVMATSLHRRAIRTWEWRDLPLQRQ